MISAILLAAGESRRMGKLKQLMPLGGRGILEHSIDNLLGSRVGEVIVVLGCEAEVLVKKVATRPVRIAMNSAYQEGMSTSIARGLALVDDRVGAVMLALADQPFIDSHVINRMIDEFDTHNKGIVIPVYKGRMGHPIIFTIKYKGELLMLSGDTGGRAIIDQHLDDVLEVAVGSEGICIDIDNLSSYHLEKSKFEKRRNKS